MDVHRLIEAFSEGQMLETTGKVYTLQALIEQASKDQFLQGRQLHLPKALIKFVAKRQALQTAWQSDVEQTLVEVISNRQVSKIPHHIPQGNPVEGWQAAITTESLLGDNPDLVYWC